MNPIPTVGGRLRLTRKSAGMSLSDVAGKAGMSISTLSRIETGKQPIEVQTLLMLASIIGVEPVDLITSAEIDADPVDPLVRRLHVLDQSERMRLWHQLAEHRNGHRSDRSATAQQLAMEVEELLAQIDLLRAEIDSVRRRMKN